MILVSEISKCITEVEAENLKSFYLEILAKPGFKKNFTKPKI
jgi:mRNA deadenylase 3'-5' endonuclease subunit Ccr4